MKAQQLEVQSRDQIGSAASGRLRREGKVPAVVYGHESARNLLVDYKAFETFYASTEGSSALVELIEGGKKTLTVLQDVQRHPIRQDFLHVDFHEVRSNERIHATVHVHLVGTPIGVKNEGGVVEQQLHELHVDCLPNDLPEHVDVKIESLHAGDAFHIRDLPEIQGLQFTDEPDAVIVAVAVPGGTRAMAGAEEMEAEAEAKAAEKTEKMQDN